MSLNGHDQAPTEHVNMQAVFRSLYEKGRITAEEARRHINLDDPPKIVIDTPAPEPAEPDALDEMINLIKNDQQVRERVERELFKDRNAKQKKRVEARIKAPVETSPALNKRSFAPMIPPRLILYDPKKLNGTAKNVYCWMLMHSHGKKQCDAGQQRMADELQLSLRSIKYAIDALELAGAVTTLQDVRGNRDVYELNWRHTPPKKDDHQKE